MRVASPSARRLITRREIRARFFSNMFLGSLVLTVVIIFAIFAIASLVGQNNPIGIGVVGEAPAGALENLAAVAELQDVEVEVLRFASEPEGLAAIDDGDVDGFVFDNQLVMKRADAELISLVSPAWQQAALVSELDRAGLSSEAINQALSATGELGIVEIDADPDTERNQNLAFMSVIIIFIAIQLSGAYIMLGVFEEKASKVIELVLSAVRARDLLLGKLIAIGLLGVLQVLLLAGSALVAAAVFGSDVASSLSPSLIGTGLVWFVLGYMLYGSMFAAGSSLAPSQEDAQSTLAPVSLVLMVSYFATLPTTGDPDSLLGTVTNWLPFTAPFAMPGRVAAGESQWWEVAGSMAVTALVAIAVFAFAERIYVRSVIHTDRKLGWREAWTLQA